MDFCWQKKSLLYSTLARFVTAFLPRSKHPLISWLQSPSAVILELKKIKSVTVFHYFPTYLPWSESARLHRHRRIWEELPQVWGQGWRLRQATPRRRSGQQPRGATPRPRSSSCTGTGEPRGATPRPRSGGAAVRRNPLFTVRRSGCALLEQPWRDTPGPRRRNQSKTVGAGRGHQRADTLKP